MADGLPQISSGASTEAWERGNPRRRGTIRSYVRGDGLTRARFPLHLFRSAFFRVTVVVAGGGKAWTNPIWLDERP